MENITEKLAKNIVVLALAASAVGLITSLIISQLLIGYNGYMFVYIFLLCLFGFICRNFSIKIVNNLRTLDSFSATNKFKVSDLTSQVELYNGLANCISLCRELSSMESSAGV